MAKVNKLDSQRKLKKLEPRPSPYYERVSEGVFVGYRKTALGSGKWVGRTRIDGSQNHAAFDSVDSYDDAVTSVLAWTKGLRGNGDQNKSVKDVIDEYIKGYAAAKGEDSACATQTRLYAALPDALLNKKLTLLKASHIRGWMNDLVTLPYRKDKIRTKSTANRIYNNFKAAMNMAYKLDWIADKPWEKVEAFKNADKARDLFLTDRQVLRLIDSTSGALKRLVQASVFTGARYGELAGAKVKDFLPHESTLKLSGKTGERTAWLSDEATGFFQCQAASKLPDAFLLTQDNGKHWGKANYDRNFRLTCKRAKLPNETMLYSLRHYHISKALLAGVSIQVVAENCGTSVRMIEKHYGKFLAVDRQQMMNTVALAVQCHG